MRLENLTEGNGSYPTQTSDPTRRCGVAPQQGLTALHLHLVTETCDPFIKGRRLWHRAGLVPPTYRRQPTIVMRPNLRPSERSERGRSPRKKKRFGVRASGAARSERSEPRPCERPTRKLFFSAGRGPGGGKIQQGRRAKKQ